MKNTKNKIFKLNEKLINFFDYIFNYKNFKNLKGTAKLNKILIPITCIYFLYLFYLTIPSLYDKAYLQKDLSKKIREEFNLNISFSSDISYSILPRPHFLIKDVKIFNELDKSKKEITQIKKLKLFITQSNLFHKEKIKLKKIVIQDANFLIQKKDFSFLSNFFEGKFSKKPIYVKNSNFFFNDKNDTTVFFFPIKKMKNYYDIKKDQNVVLIKGKIFNTPFKVSWNKSKNEISQNFFIINLKKLNFEFQNSYLKKNDQIHGINTTFFKNGKITSDYKLTTKFLEFVSKDTRLVNNKINYNGKINFNPFDINLNLNSQRIKLSKLFQSTILFQELMRDDLLFNKNLSANVSITSNQLTNNRLFDSMSLFINFDNGIINFNNTNLISNKIGTLELFESYLQSVDNETIFTGKFNFIIKDKQKFFRTFQIPKKQRKELKNIYFTVEYNVFKNKLKILNFKLNNPKDKITENVRRILEEINYDDKGGIDNWIDLKNMTNKIITSYFG